MKAKSIIQVQLKLKLRPAQERMLNRWLWHLTGVYNWAVRKIELDAKDRVYHSRYDLEALLVRHSKRLGIPSRVIEGTARTAHDAWRRCFKRLAARPRMKGRRNRLNSILFREQTVPAGRKLRLSGVGIVGFHAQPIPDGAVKMARVVKRASGWYCCLFIEAEPNAIQISGDGAVGIDPGFSSLLTLSTGEKVDRASELARTSTRLAQAQRGSRIRLTARLKEHEANQRKDRNHKLSRRLVGNYALIAWSKDNSAGLSRSLGKSVASAAHGQLRMMLSYKCRLGGRQFVEVPGRYSTVTCSACGARSGPAGYAGLKVRQWECACGARHDRDINAAINTLNAGLGFSLEMAGDRQSGIAI